MASRISELIVKIGAQTGDFKRELSSVTKTLQSESAKLTSIGATFGLGLTAPIAALGAASVRAFGDIDALKRGLITVSSSAAEAEKQFTDLREVAKLPGLGFKEAVQGAVNLRAVGFSAADTNKILGEFGNALAGVGRGREDLNEVVRQLGQLASRGKVTADNLKPIIERVPQAAAIINREFKTLDTEALQKLGVDSDKFIKVLLDGLSQLPRATGGIKNEFENLKDSVEISLSESGKALEPFASAVLRVIQPAIGGIASLAQSFGSLSPALQSAIVGLTGLAASIGPISLLIGQLKSLQAVALGILPVFAGPQGILWAMGAGIVAAVAIALPELLRLETSLDETFNKLDAFNKQKEQLKFLEEGTTGPARSLEELQAAAKGNEEAFKKFGSAVQQGFIDKGLSFEIVKSANAADTLKSALGTLNVKGPAEVSAQVSKLKEALDAVQQAYKRGEVDLATLNRATAAYQKEVKELTGQLEKTKAAFDFGDFVKDEVFSRITTGWGKARDAVADFTSAQFDLNVQARMTATMIAADLNPVVDTLGSKLRASLGGGVAEAIKLNAELTTLAAQADITNQILAANSRSPVRNLPLPGTVGTDERMRGAGIDTQGDLRRKADELGDIYEQVNNEVKAGARSAKDAKRAYEEWTQAERDAAGITGKVAKQSKDAWGSLGRQVSTVVTDLSRSLADVIFEGGKVKDIFRSIGIDIAKSITRYAIEGGINLLIKSLGQLLVKVIDVGGTFGKIFGSAGDKVGKAAGSLGSAASSGGGGEEALAGGGGGGGGGILGILSQVSTVLQYLQGRRMEQDIGRIEVTSRSIMNDLANLRADEWARFTQSFLRQGEILNAVRGIYDGLSAIDFSGVRAAGVAGGGAAVMITGPVTFQVQGRNGGELLEDIARQLKLVSAGFNRA